MGIPATREQGRRLTLSTYRHKPLRNAHWLRTRKAIVELEKEPNGWAAHMQRQLLEARDIAAHGCRATGGLAPVCVDMAAA